MALFEDLATHLACQGELTRMNLQKGGKIQVTTLERRRRRGFQVERGMAAPLAVENEVAGCRRVSRRSSNTWMPACAKLVSFRVAWTDCVELKLESKSYL